MKCKYCKSNNLREIDYKENLTGWMSGRSRVFFCLKCGKVSEINDAKGEEREQ